MVCLRPVAEIRVGLKRPVSHKIFHSAGEQKTLSGGAVKATCGQLRPTEQYVIKTYSIVIGLFEKNTINYENLVNEMKLILNPYTPRIFLHRFF